MKRTSREIAFFICGVILACCLSAVVTASDPAAGQSPTGNHAERKSEAAVENGKKVYGRHCAVCHHSATTAKKIGPGLKGIYERGKFEDGSKVDDSSMRRWIEKGGKNMPGFEDDLKPQELTDLIAYLKTL